MNRFGMAVIALAGAGALAPIAAAQTPPPRPEISARDTLTEQLDALAARIGRREARGRLGHTDAAEARKTVDALRAEASQDHVRDGGRISEADRFALEAEIRQLRTQIDTERTAAPASPSH